LPSGRATFAARMHWIMVVGLQGIRVAGLQKRWPGSWVGAAPRVEGWIRPGEERFVKARMSPFTFSTLNVRPADCQSRLFERDFAHPLGA
jgi:hypothetical protein